MAEKYADEHSIPKLILNPEYARYGRHAPLMRNKLIVEVSDMIVAIWDGKSPGTRYTIDYARRLGKRVIVYNMR